MIAHRRKSLALAAIAALASATSLAAVYKDVKLPDQVTVGGKTLALNGAGMRQATMFNVDVYVGALYLAGRSSDPAKILASDAPKQVTMVFVRDLDREKLVNAFKEGVEGNCTQNCGALGPGLKALDATLTSVKPGDRMTFEFFPDKVRVTNGKLPPGAQASTIEGAAFSRALLSVWLGEHPPTDDLKRGMLGIRAQ